MGILAAKNIMEDEKNDLWEINTDYEYQESSTITATGLSLDWFFYDHINLFPFFFQNFYKHICIIK